MTEQETWQVSSEAAEVYEASFVPSIFGAWPPVVAAAAAIGVGDRVLDVACGTGVLSRYVVERVGPAGAVTGLDINPAMLAVARRIEPRVDWRQGSASDLPFDDESFNRVVSQFGLMYFPDRIGALSEMWRVLAPGGRLAVAVWASVDEAPGYQILVDVARQHVPGEAAAVFAAPFVLGDREKMRKRVTAADIAGGQIALERGEVRFDSVREFVRIEVKGSPLAEAMDTAAMERLAEACEAALADYVQPSGEIIMPIAALVITAQKPAA